MIVEIDHTNLEDSVDLLVRGFRKHSYDFWRFVLERLQNFSGNRITNVPIGYLLVVNYRPCGVMLTPASYRTNPDGTQCRLINFCSWYIEPEERWRSVKMIRDIMQKNDATYIDVSAVPHVVKLMEMMDFERLNDGQTYIPTPYAALFSGGTAKVLDLNEVANKTVEPELWALIMEHTELECVGAWLLDGERSYPLVFKFVSRYGVPLACMVYCANNTVLLENLGPVSRYLLKKGRLIMQIEIPRGRSVPGLKLRDKKVFLASRKWAEDATDCLGTDYALFDYRSIPFS